MNVTEAEKRAYKKFIAAGMSAYGACGLIGNLEAESDFCSDKVEKLCLQRLAEAGMEYTDESYTAAVDSGEISCEDFIHPLPGKQYGYGLAMWTTPGRKTGLWTLAKSKGVSIADEEMQLEYLLGELENSFKTVFQALKTVADIQEASDMVLMKFEVPAEINDEKKIDRAMRAKAVWHRMNREDMNMGKTAKRYVDVMRGWIGKNSADGSHREIIDLYNSHLPLARGYRVKYTDQWCDTTISAAAVQAGMTDLIGTECGCEKHVAIFKKLGIWNEDGTITPEPGYIIVYNWDDNTQPNNGYSDHIGVVESVENGMITCIEGNLGGAVARRTIPVGWGYIRGYAAPNYDTEICAEPQWVGVVKAESLDVHTAAGAGQPIEGNWPKLSAGNLVDVCDSVAAVDGSSWYYIRIGGRVYGFVPAEAVGLPDLRYTVQPGDTLSTIARHHNTTWHALASYNQITNPNIIMVGQIILIPQE